MNNRNNNFGPFWTVNTQEMVLVVYIVGIVIIASQYPVAMMGMWVASFISDMRIVIFGIPAVMVLAHVIYLMRIYHRHGGLVVLGVIGLEWLFVDRITHKSFLDMWSVGKVVDIIGWMFASSAAS